MEIKDDTKDLSTWNLKESWQISARGIARDPNFFNRSLRR